MKRKIFVAFALMAISFAGFAKEKADIIKTGYNVGGLPAVAFDADKGLQLGAIVNLFDYGDGTNYPNYNSKLYLEYSHFTKGSSLIQVAYDNKELIPGVRWSSAAYIVLDKAYDFYGFNGYSTNYDMNLMTPFYRRQNTYALVKSDFLGKITPNLKWELGYHAGYFALDDIDYANINKGKDAADMYPETEPTLFALYKSWGLIGEDEADGGFVSSIRAGLMYDTRDKEGAPTRGIWAEGHITAAPKFLGTTMPFAKYSVTFRQYFPIVDHDILTFAYRLNYEGTFGNKAPYYILPFITVMGENTDKNGMGGYRTVRGILRDRVVGLDMATYTAELRWRFAKFHAANQNISLGLSAFSDGTMVTRGRDLTFNGDVLTRPLYNLYIQEAQKKDTPHITFGSGFRIIMNENFIIAAEYGMPVSHLMKNSPVYNQDGTGAFYINIGYLF